MILGGQIWWSFLRDFCCHLRKLKCLILTSHSQTESSEQLLHRATRIKIKISQTNFGRKKRTTCACAVQVMYEEVVGQLELLKTFFLNFSFVKCFVAATEEWLDWWDFSDTQSHFGRNCWHGLVILGRRRIWKILVPLTFFFQSFHVSCLHSDRERKRSTKVVHLQDLGQLNEPLIKRLRFWVGF